MKTRQQMLQERLAGTTKKEDDGLGLLGWATDKVSRAVQNTELDIKRAAEQRRKEGYGW